MTDDKDIDGLAGEYVLFSAHQDHDGERYPVNVRYMRDFRADVGALSRVLVAASGGQRQIPLAQLATIKTVSGPAMIRSAGHCNTMGTASTMASMVESLGMGLPTNAAIPPS